MNINDFQDVQIPEGDMLEVIFAHQRKLMDRYHEIEENNIGHPIPFKPSQHGPYCGSLDIQDRASQLRCKSFAWRITEEITEATLCLRVGHVEETHYLEELADALHFSVELLCLSGIKVLDNLTHGDKLEALFDHSPWSELDMYSGVGQEELKALAYNVIEKLGEAMNRLKLKEWKSTAMLTDVAAYKKSLIEFFYELINLMKASGFTARTLAMIYLQKNAVNQFRQASNY